MLLLALQILSAPSPVKAGEDAPRHILLLNSYHQNMTWVQNIVRAVQDEFQTGEEDLILHIENMDSKRFHGLDYFLELRDFYARKYASTEFDLILSSDDNAYDFLRLHRDPLFPGVPVVFCGVNYFRPEQLNNISGFTGVEEVFDARATLEIALRNHPRTRQVLVINDFLKSGRSSEETIKNQLRNFPGNLLIDYVEDLSMAELEDKIRNLPPDSLVLLGVFFADREGLYVTFEHIGAMLARAGRVPVYCLFEFNIGQAIVGGNVISGYAQGQRMAEFGRRILNGEAPESIEVLRSGSNRDIFDYQQLERFDIDENNLPPNSKIINRPFSFYQAYRLQIWIIGAVISLLAATVATLAINIRSRRSTERQLQESEKQLRDLIEQSPVGLILTTVDGEVLAANPAFAGILGYSVDEVLQLNRRTITPDQFLTYEDEMLPEVLESGRYGPYEKEYYHRDGHPVPVRVNGMFVTRNGRKLIWSSVEDITAIKEAETKEALLAEQLRQSQKMESIGTLAGGIAHDFNNILAAILGYTELTLYNGKCDEQTSENLNNILTATVRARDLVRQILTFSRHEQSSLKTHEIHTIVHEAIKLIGTTLPASVEFAIDIDPASGTVQADPTQIHQLVMNLCTNAWHALPQANGKITVSLKPFTCEQTLTTSHGEVPAGDYALLSISDSGTGIPADVLPRIFDPFFTTKDQGQGTGMGLSVSHAIITNHKGVIDLQSAADRGTVFSIYLPLTAEGAEHDEQQDSSPLNNRAHEHILLIDDEPTLNAMWEAQLSPLGYKVTSTSSAVEGWELFKAAPDAFDLIISDQTMPHMTGDSLARQALQLRSDIPIIICTGHSAMLNENIAAAIGIKALLNKPIRRDHFIREVQRVLNEAHTNRNRASALHPMVE